MIMNGKYRYSYEMRGVYHCIYDGGTKIAEISEFGEKGRAIAHNMVTALNSRDKYLQTVESRKFGER